MLVGENSGAISSESATQWHGGILGHRESVGKAGGRNYWTGEIREEGGSGLEDGRNDSRGCHKILSLSQA